MAELERTAQTTLGSGVGVRTGKESESRVRKSLISKLVANRQHNTFFLPGDNACAQAVKDLDVWVRSEIESAAAVVGTT